MIYKNKMEYLTILNNYINEIYYTAIFVYVITTIVYNIIIEDYRKRDLERIKTIDNLIIERDNLIIVRDNIIMERYNLIIEREKYKKIAEDLQQSQQPQSKPYPSLKNTIIEYLRKNPNTTTIGILRGISNDYTAITLKELTRYLYSLQHKDIVFAKGGSGVIYWTLNKSE
jgi:hypothetical protein